MKILILDSFGGEDNLVPLENAQDKNGHGSLMFKIIQTINPEADVAAVKIVNTGGFTSTDLLCSGLIYAWEHKFDIVSISLGVNYLSAEVKFWLDMLAKEGVIVCAASGNNFYSTLAQYPTVVSVGALDEEGNVADYTVGWDVLAPGYFDGQYGTSIACAYYVGLLSRGGD